jgi:hypothetical protein
MIFVKQSLVIAIGIAIIASSSAVLAADTVIATCSKLINGSEYSFQILITANGAAYQRIYQNGIEVSSESEVAKTVISPLQLAKSTALDDNETLRVNLSLVTADISTSSEAEQGGAIVKDDRIEKLEHNGKSLANDESLAFDEKLAGPFSLEQATPVNTQSKKLSAFAERYGFSTSRVIKTSIAEGQASVSTVLTGAILRNLVESIHAELSGLELYFPIKDRYQQRNVTNTSISPYQS